MMRLHWKKGSKMHKDGRHRRKYAMLRPALDEEVERSRGRNKMKHFKHAIRKGSMLASEHHHGKWWKHCKGVRGRSSSSDSDDEHHHDKGKHGKGGHHHGKAKHFEVLRGLSTTTSNSDDEAGQPGIPVVEDDVLRCGRKTNATTTDSEAGGRRRGRRRHFRVMRVRSVLHSDDEEMPRWRRRCVSDVEGGRHRGRRMRFGMRMGGHRGRGEEHGRGWRMSDSDDDHHHHHGEKGMRHMRGMMRRRMHHHGWKRGMEGHGRRGFFDGDDDDDGVLVPICATRVEGEDRPGTTSDKGNTHGNPTTGTSEEVAEGGARTRDQGTQTTGILEIVIEDQEAAIRIANKFL